MMPALSAVIPAAGLSSRMHRFKPLLKFGKSTMLEVVIRLFQTCGIQDILVVTGFNHALLEPVIQSAGARPVFNPDFETGMLGSIQTGVAQVAPGSHGFFLLPVDIAAIRPSTLEAIASAFVPPFDDIILPAFNQIPGHPPLIPARLVQEILGMDPASNLGQLLLSRKHHLKHLPVHDQGILMDADTREAYDALARKYQRMDIPDTAECWSIIRSLLPDETVIQSHLAKVAEVAGKLVQAVEPGLCLDKDLVQAAALLHDIQRKEKNHDRAGGLLLNAMGFPGVAGIVAGHMTLVPGDDLGEKEIVYFADKLCNGSQVELDYAQRFTDKIKQAPGARKKIVQRYEASRHIQARIEAVAGCSIRTILQ